MLLWIDFTVSPVPPLYLDPAVYGFSEAPYKRSKCIYICLLYLYAVSLRHHYFCAYGKTATATDCRHAEINPFVRLLKGGGLTSEVKGFFSLSGEKDEKQRCAGSGGAGVGGGVLEPLREKRDVLCVAEHGFPLC